MNTRRLASLLMILFAACVSLLNFHWALAVAILIVVDVLTYRIPWSVPRASRSAWSYFAEQLSYYLAATAAAIIIALQLTWALPSYLEILAGVTLGVALMVGTGLLGSSLLNGDYAFLMSDGRRSHAAARLTAVILAVPVEELLFRGVLLLAIGQGAFVPLLLASPLAFVARHHLMVGIEHSGRNLTLQLGGAAGLTAVTILTGSVFSAFLAHALANTPQAIIAVQQLGPRISNAEEDEWDH